MSFLRDVHQCARSLAKSPSLPAIAILSLGLGIGVNTTLFSLFKSLFLDDISAAQPGRLVRAWVGGTNRMSFANFRDLENSRAFSGWAGYTMAPFTLRTGEQGSKIWGQIVTPNFFDVLGVKTASGRTFSNDEQAAVLSHAFWRQRFEGASDAIGRTINLNNQTYTIVGVLPEGYRSVLGFAVSPQVYVPFSTNLNRDLMERSRTGTLEAFGRLAPGVMEMQAKSALLAGAQELKRLYPKENEFLDKVELFPMSGLGRVRAKGYPTPLAVFSIALLVISGLVLLIACANVSGLLLARGLNRKRDITVRLALGASRKDILRHLLAESCVLATLGTGAGLLISLWFTAALPALPLPISFPMDLHVSADWRLIVYATALAFASTIACGLTPAWQALQFSVVAGLGDRSGQASRRGVALRNTLVVGQVAVSFALLVIASMALRSLQYVSQVNPGFDTDNVLNVKLETAHKQMTPDQQERFLDGQLQELRKIPGVLSATAASLVPLSGDSWLTEVTIDGSRAPVGANAVLEGYFETMGIAVLRGRSFMQTDRSGSTQVAVINQTLANRYWKTSDAIGKRLRLLRGPKQYDELEIVGVVADSKYNTLGEDTRLLVYRPYRQAKMNFPTIHLKTAGAPATLIPGVRTALAGMDRTVVPELQTMQESLAFALIPSRIAAVLLGGMGTIGLALALTGLYGSLAYAVSRRTAEIGIRMALGASRGTVFATVMRDAGLLIGAGLGIGGLLAFAASVPLSQFVAGVHVTDAGSLPAVAALMLLVGVAASYVPARRATKVDPVVALRYE